MKISKQEGLYYLTDENYPEITWIFKDLDSLFWQVKECRRWNNK